ncbi:hypothetical protein [Nocardioides iriomotensis]|uniref:Uncharacterized protein n=1 Tax=Nocardioides iriomotensis TaxID=715784 RepID=A0A4Q5J363_9ACTN|nr:hypothetical protein [Nocardioides iriomotensis]RYU11795.1 hypothetical protein ETU37_11010 [Nocardioides iriomotensis]
MTQEAAPGTTSTPVPTQRTVQHELPTDQVSAGEQVRSVEPVAFDRLLSVAVLTPAQASLLAVQLIEAARLDGAGNGSSPAGTRLAGVTLTPAGEIGVTRSAAGAGTTVTELIEQLLDSARRLPAHPKPDQLVLLRSLEEAAADPLLDPEARARALEGALVDTLGPGARQRLTRQLAALVAAFGHVAPGVLVGAEKRPAPGPVRSAAPARSAADLNRAAPPRPPASHAGRRSRVLLRRRTKGRAVLVALVLAAVLAVGGYVVLNGPGSDFAGSLGREDNPAAPDTTAPDQPSGKPPQKPDRDRAQAVASVAPRQAGPVTGVVLQSAGSCRPGSLCPVTVTVHFRPASISRTVGWKVGAARVCRPGITWSGPVTVTAQPGWTTVYASSSVRVPKGRRLALTALTTTPARAQSRPVPVAGASLQC